VRIAIFVGLFVAVSQWQQSGLLSRGEPAPDFTATTLDGRRVQLSDYRGKRVLLHFWATWCGVCRQEFGMLNRLHHSLAEDSVLLTVVADGDNPQLAEFVLAQGLDYPILRTERGVLTKYKVGAFPTNYFVDAAGMIRSRTVGLATSWSMRSRLSCAR
jgi:peroxiredoxin